MLTLAREVECNNTSVDPAGRRCEPGRIRHIVPGIRLEANMQRKKLWLIVVLMALANLLVACVALTPAAAVLQTLPCAAMGSESVLVTPLGLIGVASRRCVSNLPPASRPAVVVSRVPRRPVAPGISR
jgi:hypothetical protein